MKVQGSAWVLAWCVLGAVAVYGTGLRNGFQYDDHHMVVYNPAIRDLGLIPQMLTDTGVFSGTEQVRHYRPLVLASYAVDYAMSGPDPLAYHATNILAHGLTAWLVFLLAGAWGVARPGALVAGFLFLIVPVHSEAVNYVAARSSLLATLFTVAALYAFSRFRERDGAPQKALAWLVASYGFWGLGLLSKEIAIVAPALMIAFDILIARTRRRAGALVWAAPYLPLVAGAAYYLWKGDVMRIMTMILAGEGNRDPLRNVWTQLRVAVRALGLYVWPAGLSVHHEIPVSTSWVEWRVLAAAAVLIALTAGAAWAARRTRNGNAVRSCLAMGWVWFVVASLPTSVIPLTIQFQEHRLYFPGVGLAIGLGALAYQGSVRVSERHGVARSGVVMIGAAAALGMVVLDVHRTRLWGDGLSLWEDAQGHNPPSARIQNGIGIGHLRAGDNAAALARFEAALHVDPTFREAFANSAYVLQRLGRPDGALAMYEALTRNDPHQGQYFLMVGGLRHLKGDLAGAEEAYRATLRLNPRFADAYEGLGGVLFQRGAYTESVDAFETAKRLGLTHPMLRVRLAHAYHAAGKVDAALAEAEAVFRDAPNTTGLADLLEAVRAERENTSGSESMVNR